MSDDFFPAFDDPDCPKFRKENFDTGRPFQEPPGSDQDGDTPFIEEWDEKDGSPELEMRDDGSQAVRTVWVPWDDGPELNSPRYFEAARNILGYPVLTPGGSTGWFISRKTPVYYPECVASQHEISTGALADDQPRGFLYATQIRRLQGYGVPLNPGKDGTNRSYLDVNRYLAAKLAILYESLPYEIMEDDEMASTDFGAPDEATLQRYVTIQPNPSGFQLLLAPGSLHFVKDGIAVVGSPPRNVPNFDVEIIHHHVPIPAVGLRQINPYIATTSDYVAPIEACLGCVNDADFPASPGGGYPVLSYAKGTLLLNSVQIVRVRSALGNRLVNVHYRFAQLTVRELDFGSLPPTPAASGAQGWNCQFYSLHPPGGYMGWYEAVAGAGPTFSSNFSSMTPGLSMFDFADFRTLFRPPKLTI